MRPVLQKLFRTGQESANVARRAPARPEPANDAAAASGSHVVSQTRDEDPALKSDTVAQSFDSIGGRNETLRAQLDSIEFSFRNIEAIRTQFHQALTLIAQTLEEIERTKLAHLEAERKRETLTAANDRMQRDRAELAAERDALAVAHNDLLARAADLERAAAAGEAAASEARATLMERSARLDEAQRELEESRRALNVLGEQLLAIRAELATRETRLQDVERQRAAQNDHCGLLTQENDALRVRMEEFVVIASKLSRELSEQKNQRDELKRLLGEVETALGQETAAHAELRAAHLDAVEAHRLNEANLQEKVAATSTRLDAAEQLLIEARTEMHEQDAAFRESEQRVLEKSLEAKSLEAQIVDLEKDLASARAAHVEAEVARTVTVEQSATLAGSLRDKELALHRAEQKIATVEVRFEEHRKTALRDRASLEEKIARLTEQLEAESAARLFAEGALQSARQERTARREQSQDVPADSLSVGTKPPDGNITWLSR